MQVCICPTKYLYITSNLDQKRGVGKNQVRRLGNWNDDGVKKANYTKL